MGGDGLLGGEEEALQRLQKFALEARSQTSNLKASKSQSESSGDSLYGANFSCKISPWLTMGCLSPRRMFEDLKKSASRFAPCPLLAAHELAHFFLVNDQAYGGMIKLCDCCIQKCLIKSIIFD